MGGRGLRVLCWPIGDEDTAFTRHRLLNLRPFFVQHRIRGTRLRGGETSLATAIQGMAQASTVDKVYLQKKLLPPWYLALLRRRTRILAFDFDDALYAPRSRATPAQERLPRRLKAGLDRTLPVADLASGGGLEHTPRGTNRETPDPGRPQPLPLRRG
jgi:hypothetical protein